VTSDLGLKIFYGRSFRTDVVSVWESGRDEMKQVQVSVKNLARLLETAAKKCNESADAICSVAECLERPDCALSDETFDRVFDSVTELARVSLDKKPDYRRAARDLLAKSRRRSKSA